MVRNVIQTNDSQELHVNMMQCMSLSVSEHYTLQHVPMLAGFRLVNTKCMMLVDMWKKIQHSNAVTLREVFTTKAFGDHCKGVLLSLVQELLGT